MLIPHAYRLCSFCLSNSDIKSYLQTWSTLLTFHTAQNNVRFHVLCRGHGRHSYIHVHTEVQTHRFANSHLLELCGNLQHWKLCWTPKGVTDTSMSDGCPKHLVSGVFPWSLAIFCYFSLNFPYYLHNNNNNNNNNNNKTKSTWLWKRNQIYLPGKWYIPRNGGIHILHTEWSHFYMYLSKYIIRYPASCPNYFILVALHQKLSNTDWDCFRSSPYSPRFQYKG